MCCGCLGVFFHKEFRILTCQNWLLNVNSVWNVSLHHLPKIFPEGSLSLTAPQALRIGGASERCSLSCSNRKCPQGNSSSACPTLVPLARKSLGEISLLGCELLWKVPEEALKGLASVLLPLKLHPSPLDSSQPEPQHPPEGPRKLHSQEGSLNWAPEHQDT